MVFKKLTATNFRGIKHTELSDLNQINLIVGKNNSGKSSVLESLFLLTGLHNPELVLRIDQFRNLLHNEENDFRYVFYNLKYQNTPELEVEYHTEDSTRRLSIKPVSTITKGSDSIELSINKLGDLSDSASSISLDDVNSLTFEGEIKKRHSQKKILRSSITLDRKSTNTIGFVVKTAKEAKDDLRAIFLNKETTLSGTHRRVESIIIQKRKHYILDNLRKIDDSIIDVSTGSNNMIYFDIGADRLLPANLLGDGINKIIAIISSLNELKNGILLIDEIDNGLHYSALDILWQFVFNLSLQNNNQLFITTHNYDVLNYVVKFIEANKEQHPEYSRLLNCYSLAKVPGNEVKSYKYKYEELFHAVENKIEIRGNA